MSNTSLADSNGSWVKWVGTLAVPIMIAGLGLLQYQLQSIENRVDNNSNRIWEQQKVAVTEDKLNRSMDDIIQLVDTKLQSVNGRLDIITRQLDVVSNSLQDQRDANDKFKDQIRQTIIESIKNSNK